MNKLILMFCLLLPISVTAQTSKIKNKIKEEVIGQPIEKVVEETFDFLGPLKSIWAGNQVHSAKYGKGFKVTIKNFESDISLYAKPIKGVGKRTKLLATTYLFPGMYQITTAKGTKSLRFRVDKNKTVDYLNWMQLTQTKGDVDIGRIKINILPENAKIVIYGTPHKYHEGLQLPVGKYRVKVSHKGYQTLERMISVEKLKLTTETFSLKKLSGSPSSNNPDVEVVRVTGSAKTGTEITKKLEREVESKADDFLLQVGQLYIEPLVEGVRYTVVDKSDRRKDYEPDMALDVGRYTVIATIAESGVFLESRVANVEPLGRTKVAFSIKKNEGPETVKVNFELNKKRSFRSTVELNLTNENDEEFVFKERMSGKQLVIEAELLTGRYTGSLKTKNSVFELGELVIKANTSKTFSINLD